MNDLTIGPRSCCDKGKVTHLTHLYFFLYIILYNKRRTHLYCFVHIHTIYIQYKTVQYNTFKYISLSLLYTLPNLYPELSFLGLKLTVSIFHGLGFNANWNLGSRLPRKIETLLYRQICMHAMDFMSC
jgi:hypothetical protein